MHDVEGEQYILFDKDEPRLGTFSTIIEDCFIYLFSEFEDKIIIARVHRNTTASRATYEFWDGLTYTSEATKAVPVFHGMQQGSVFRAKLFGSSKPFAFVGCNSEGDSSVIIGAAARLEGPWELTPVCAAKGINYPVGPGRYMYCMYPHLWASIEEEGKLMVTWSEGWPGGVVVANISLATVGDIAGDDYEFVH